MHRSGSISGSSASQRANEYARKKAQAQERAQQLRQERKRRESESTVFERQPSFPEPQYVRKVQQGSGDNTYGGGGGEDDYGYDRAGGSSGGMGYDDDPSGGYDHEYGNSNNGGGGYADIHAQRRVTPPNSLSKKTPSSSSVNQSQLTLLKSKHKLVRRVSSNDMMDGGSGGGSMQPPSYRQPPASARTSAVVNPPKPKMSARVSAASTRTSSGYGASNTSTTGSSRSGATSSRTTGSSGYGKRTTDSGVSKPSSTTSTRRAIPQPGTKSTPNRTPVKKPPFVVPRDSAGDGGGDLDNQPVASAVRGARGKSGADFYEQAIMNDPEANAMAHAEPTYPCRSCGRSFREEALSKHEGACAKAQKKPRKVFDSAKNRVLGTEAEDFVVKRSRGKVVVAAPQVKKPRSNWRAKRDEFRAAMRAAKTVENFEYGKGELPPPPPPAQNPDFVQCPTCGRTFNETAAERHIPKCGSIINKPKMLVRKTVSTAVPRRGAPAKGGAGRFR
eukprot:GFYU01004516.1.p1 GENE.GFYU01004516.1~~GFYU01004516.1.p1  ORF type:complete len:502 (-),score=90.22 GFYU01004516.1:189-1694(-)